MTLTLKKQMIDEVESKRKLYASNSTGVLKINLPKNYCQLKGLEEGDYVTIKVSKVSEKPLYVEANELMEDAE